MNSNEIDGGASVTVDFEAARDGEITVKSNGVSKKTFKFDAVFSPEADQSNCPHNHAFPLITIYLYSCSLTSLSTLLLECSSCF